VSNIKIALYSESSGGGEEQNSGQKDFGVQKIPREKYVDIMIHPLRESKGDSRGVDYIK